MDDARDVRPGRDDTDARLRELEQANAALRRANATLGSGYLGRADAGGASPLARLHERLAAQETEISALRAELAFLKDLAEGNARSARENDALLQHERALRRTGATGRPALAARPARLLRALRRRLGGSSGATLP